MAESSTSSGLGGKSGGCGQYCCVPECGNVRYDKFGNKTHIGLFKFPSKDKKPQKYQSWVKAISMYRRRCGGDTFDPSSKNTVYVNTILRSKCKANVHGRCCPINFQI